ncbi:MAG: APC family permease [Acidimicrobiia bacterium]
MMLGVLKRMLVGRPLATTQMEEQRLPKTIALAVFSSDALSSTAYATEEILFVVAIGGSSLALGLSRLVPIAVVVAALLAIVIVSYRQVIFAYPSGGGAYVVSQENIGEMASLVAGASLMVDYVLTVAVSISAGVAAIVSIPALGDLAQHRVELGVVLIALITLLNMRGIKESGRVFAVPTYLYMFIFAGLIIYGLGRALFGDIATVPYNPHLAETAHEAGGTLTLFLLLKGFSSGAVALTGVEAISNGVPSFRRPAAKNAAATLVWMGVLLGSLFFGISILAHRLHPFPSHDRTVIAQIGLQVFGNGFLFVFLQIATAAILVLAANTAYNGFPSLSSIIASDGYLPRQLANRGDRLVFSNGIVMLAGAAALLVVAFGGITNALIPLYAVGVFTSFTLSQIGMVRHHLRLRQPHWRRSVVVNAVGGTATLVVLLIVAVTKFTSGAWVPIVVIPAIVLLFKAIKRHYVGVAEQLEIPPDYRPGRRRFTSVVLVEDVNAITLEALAYGMSIAPDRLTAVTVVSSDQAAERIEKQWSTRGITVPLEVVRTSNGEFTTATLAYLDELAARTDNTVNVLIPEFYVEHWWEHLLHNQSALVLKGRLLFRKTVAVTSIPYRVEQRSALDPTTTGEPTTGEPSDFGRGR